MAKEVCQRVGVSARQHQHQRQCAPRQAVRAASGVDVAISSAFTLDPAGGPPTGWAGAVEIGDRLARPGDAVELATALRFGDQALGDDFGDVHAATLSTAPTRMATASAASTTAAPKRRPGRRDSRSTGPLTLTAATTAPT